MKYSTLVLFISIIILGTACRPSAKELNEKQREEIISVHDEVMPLMGKVKSLEKLAISQIDSLVEISSSDTIMTRNLKSLAYDLNQAYEGMFVWMRQYETEDGEMTDEEIQEYLDDQLIKVTSVNEDIKTVLEKAEDLLKD